MNELEQIQADLQRVNHFAPDFDAAVRAAAAQRQDKNRSVIVYGVVGLYVGSVGLIVLLSVYRDLCCGECSDAAAGDPEGEAIVILLAGRAAAR